MLRDGWKGSAGRRLLPGAGAVAQPGLLSTDPQLPSGMQKWGGGKKEHKINAFWAGCVLACRAQAGEGRVYPKAGTALAPVAVRTGIGVLQTPLRER